MRDPPPVGKADGYFEPVTLAIIVTPLGVTRFVPFFDP